MHIPTTIEQIVEHEDLIFRVRLWWRSAEGGEGWCWTLTADDPTIPYQVTGKRAWVTHEAALEAATSHLARTI
jgi:hypothetical protein